MNFGRGLLISLILVSIQARADFKSAMTAAADGRVVQLQKELKRQPKLVRQVDAQGDTLLLIAVASEQGASVDEVLRHKPDLQHKNKDRFTALDLALMMGNEKLSLSLLKAGAQAQTGDILVAAEKNMAEVIQVLAKKDKKTLTHQNAEGHSALHIAALHGSGDAVKALLKAGAKTDLKNKKGQTPAEVARATGHSQTEALLK